MIGYTRALFPALLLGILPLSAHAEDCGNLRLVASIKLADSDSHRVMVPVTINGTPRTFLFDTGGVFSQLSPSLVKELKLSTHSTQFNLQDVNGYASNQAATVEDFGFGPFKAKNVTFQVATVDGQDGILAPTRFQNVDIDLDFGPRRLNMFLSDHCPGKVVYWKSSAIAVVPVTMRNAHFNLDVTTNGQMLRGIIDTGATGTFMSEKAAFRLFGLKPDSPGMEPAGFVNGDKETPAYRYTLPSLSFGGVTVSNVKVLIAPDRTGAHDRNNHLKTGSYVQREDDDIRQEDIVVGMNVLSKLHIYFATLENKLYITPAGALDEPSPFASAK